MVDTDPIMKRLEDQIAWYDRKSNRNKRWFYWFKMIEIAVAALVSALSAHPRVVTIAGVTIVILEGLQHVFQFQQNWIRYRSTCEELKHEKYFWLGKAGPYLQLEN